MKRSKALTEIAQTPVRAHLDKQNSIRLSLPYGCFFGAGSILRPDAESRLTMYELRVNPKLRKEGIGTRLMSSMIYLAAEINPDRFSGTLTSPRTPYVIRKIVSEAGVDYLEYIPSRSEEVMLPLTTAQAIDSIRQNLKYGDPEYDGIIASIKLGTVALDSLEKPAGADEVIDALRPKFESHRAANSNVC